MIIVLNVELQASFLWSPSFTLNNNTPGVMWPRYQETTNAVPVKRATPSNEKIHRSPPPVDTPNLGYMGNASLLVDLKFSFPQ